MNTLEVLEEDSFEYDGPLALCEDGGDGGDGDGDSGEGGEGNGGDSDGGDSNGGEDSGDTGGTSGDTDASESEAGGMGGDRGGDGSDGGGTGGFGEADVAGLAAAEAAAGLGYGGPSSVGGYSDVSGLAQAVANMNAMSTPAGMDYSNISVGPQMAHAQAKEAALEAGYSKDVAEAKGREAAAGYSDRNKGMYGTQTLNQMIAAINKTKTVQAIRDMFAGRPSAKDPSVSHMTSFDPHAPDMDLDSMQMAMMDMGIAPALSAMMSQTPAGKARAASAFDANLTAALQGYTEATSPKGFLSAITQKFGKKVGKTAVAAHLAGMPSALSIGMKAAMANPVGMALGPTVNAAMAHFSAKNELGEVANAFAANNPNMSREEAASAFATMSNMKGFDVDAKEVGMAMDDQWGGKEGPGGPAGEGDALDRAEPSGAAPEPTTDGGEYDTAPYEYSPLKDYLQQMYGQQGSGFMSDPYSSQGGGGAYTFRY